jgi:ribosomal protein S18 acetylase RimI-like enzyme
MISLQKAKLEDATAICNLINQAYRGDEGWTKESDIVDGDRTTLCEIESLILAPDAYLLVAFKEQSIISCICIEATGQRAYIGMFAVNPKAQCNGLGHTTLSLAENFAISELKANTLVMAVVSQRDELIAYYKRRGYQQIGQREAYPTNLNVGTPKVSDLTIEYLTKTV